MFVRSFFLLLAAMKSMAPLCVFSRSFVLSAAAAAKQIPERTRETHRSGEKGEQLSGRYCPARILGEDNKIRRIKHAINKMNGACPKKVHSETKEFLVSILFILSFLFLYLTFSRGRRILPCLLQTWHVRVYGQTETCCWPQQQKQKQQPPFIVAASEYNSGHVNRKAASWFHNVGPWQPNSNKSTKLRVFCPFFESLPSGQIAVIIFTNIIHWNFRPDLTRQCYFLTLDKTYVPIDESPFFPSSRFFSVEVKHFMKL